MRTIATGGWEAFGDPAEVKPKDDLRAHDDGVGCWCAPDVLDGVIVHNSLDQREFYERGERCLN